MQLGVIWTVCVLNARKRDDVDVGKGLRWKESGECRVE